MWASVSSAVFSALDEARNAWMADSACKDLGLGYQHGTFVYGNVFNPPSTLPKWTSATCSGFGNESTLNNCVWSDLAPYDGSLNLDTNLACTTATTGEPSLFSSSGQLVNLDGCPLCVHACSASQHPVSLLGTWLAPCKQPSL